MQHRDLHEGQVLITPCAILGERDLASPASTGIKATIIDFGLSRLIDSDGKVIHSSIPDDVFEGKGAQWDVYRSIRDTVDGDWSTYKPITNVMASASSDPMRGANTSGFGTSCNTSCNPNRSSSPACRSSRAGYQVVQYGRGVYR